MPMFFFRRRIMQACDVKDFGFLDIVEPSKYISLSSLDGTCHLGPILPTWINSNLSKDK